MVIMSAFLHMDKQAQAKPSPWLAFTFLISEVPLYIPFVIHIELLQQQNTLDPIAISTFFVSSIWTSLPMQFLVMSNKHCILL